MENIRFMKRDYQEMIEAATDTFKDVLFNYSAYGFDKEYQQMLLNREDIISEMAQAMINNYLDNYTTHPSIQEINKNKEMHYDAYEELYESLYGMAKVALITIIEKEVI